MNWSEKVEKLLIQSGRSMASVERKAKWTKNSLSGAISRKSMPQSDSGIRLAKALDVPAEWLFDDSQDWPPPQQPNVLYEMSNIDYAVLVSNLANWIQTVASGQISGLSHQAAKKDDKHGHR